MDPAKKVATPPVAAAATSGEAVDPHVPKELTMPKTDSNRKSMSVATVLLSFVIVLAGIASGYGIRMQVGAKQAPATTTLPTTSHTGETEIQVGTTYGSDDKEAFADETEGILLEGGIGGEGSHHLQRPGGDSQTVYLTSSVLDLDPFVGHRVHIWGETYTAQKAGWLMDVGRVEPLELDAELYFEE